MKIIPAAEFKTHCLRIIAEVNETGEPVTITKRGKPLVEVKPLQEKKTKLFFGCMKNDGYRFDDPFSPAYDGPWDAELGIWEPED